MTVLEQELSLLPERIDLGEKWLDENYPGWYKEIKLNKLNMKSLSSCILGQIQGEYSFARTIEGTGREHGFDGKYWSSYVSGDEDADVGHVASEIYFDTLTSAWKERIAKRLL